MAKWQNGDIEISCESISLGQTCNTTYFISFSKHLKNIRRYDIPYIHALRTQIEILTE